MSNTQPTLVIDDLHVAIEGKEILKGVSLTVNKGEIHAIMGPNGSGKSTLAHTLMGHPSYEVTAGSVLLNGEDILELEPNDRAKRGLFLAFQYPLAIPGVSTVNFLRTALKAVKGKEISVREFRKHLEAKMDLLKIDRQFAARYLNEGFSGGEKKRMEVLQMAVLEPVVAILDEIDSGLDVDAIRAVGHAIATLFHREMALIAITHYPRILHFFKPDYVHIMVNGRIVRSGNFALAEELEAKGYDTLLKELQPVEA
jgi:Fe-S cluster assembly ATP-binding protein